MEATEAVSASAVKIAPEVVRNHLRQLLTHGELADSPQLAAFLTYVVERKLEGAEDRIKAYAIATEALGRPPTFDPQNDPIVRVQAKRLRQALQIYYADPEADDSIRITMPVGGYVPEIRSIAIASRSASPPKASSPWRSSNVTLAALGFAFVALALAVWASFPLLRESWSQAVWQQPPVQQNPLGMPILRVRVAEERQIPGWFQSERFRRALESNLSLFDEFVVAAANVEVPQTEDDYRIDLSFSGAVNAVVATARLMKGTHGEILWSNRFTVPQDSIDSYELLDAVKKLSSTIGQPYGVLYSHVIADPRNSDQRCLLAGYEWFQDPARDKIEPIRLCLDGILARKPGNHVAYMMLAYIHVARFRTNQGDGPAAELLRAYNMAKRAIALRPESAGTHQAMMEVQWAREKFDLAEEAGRKAVGLNPNSSDVVADFGCRLIYQGKFSEGETYTSRAARLNAQPPVWHQFCMWLAAYGSGDFSHAQKFADGLEGERGPEAYVPVILMAQRQGDEAKIATTFERLLAYDPSFAGDPGLSLGKIGLFPDVARPIVEALNAARGSLKL